jgi:Flp pilus assembly protein TadB
MVTSHTNLDWLTTPQEIFDAMAMLALLATREYRRDMHSELSIHLAKEVDHLVSLLNAGHQLQKQMSLIGAKTSVDIRNYAIRFLSPEFRE